LPPLNGFASEWLVFQAILKSPDLPQIGLQIIIPAAGGLLALAAALAAAAFVRLYGVGFLGRGRSLAATRANETDRWSLTAMAVLAAICIFAGIFPGLVVDLMAPTARFVAAASLPLQASQPWMTLVPIAESRSTYNGLLVFVFITFSASIAAWAVHRLASRALRRGPAWDCGFPLAATDTQYGAGSFAQPVRRVLGSVLMQAREQVTMPEPGDMAPARHVVVVRDLVWERLYAPIANVVASGAGVLNKLQFLTIRQYLSLVVASLVALLLALTIWN
jgi:hypothetical protein